MTSAKSSPATFEASPASTCSPASQAGKSPGSSPAGETTDLFGQRAAPARPSASRGSRLHARSARARTLCGALDELASAYARSATTRGLPIPATYGRRFGDSSPSAARQCSMESRLRRLLDGIGSPEYEHRWKSQDTLLPPKASQLQGLARRTPVPVSGGTAGFWYTPLAGAHGRAPRLDRIRHRSVGGDANLDQVGLVATDGWASPIATAAGRKPHSERIGAGNGGGAVRLEDQVGLVGSWATPRSTEAGHSSGNPARAHDHKSRLEDQVYLAPGTWATPKANDADRGGRADRARPGERRRNLSDQAKLAAWPTPTAADGKRGNKPARPHDTGKPLSQVAVTVSSWATPTARDYKDRSNVENVPTNNLLGRQVHLVTGRWSTPSTGDAEITTAKPRPSRKATGRKTEYLGRQVHSAGWMTPTARYAYRSESFRAGRSQLHPREALGAIPSGSPATTKPKTETPYGVALNPRFGRWLQGFPAGWDFSVRSATRSSRK